ncbi:MAG: ATP synthase F1 subunit delta [Chloroflexi bacterium]|nr:ATP synthase F1 subunit delta [Chloroflexota bacterium]
MTDQKLPRAYAQALLETSSEDWTVILKKVVEKARQKKYLETLDDPGISFSKKKKSIAQLLPKSADRQVKNFLLLLAKENRFSDLGEIITQFEEMSRYGPQVQTAYITSAVPLTKQDQEEIQEMLTHRFPHQALAFRFQVDPQILGGVIVQVGDKVIDGSLAGKLEALREKLRSG